MIRPLVVALAVFAPIQARADELQARLVAGARATDTSGHAFRQTIAASGTGVGGKTFVTAYDPRRAPDDRWRLVSVDGRAPTPQELEKARKQKRERVPTYADLAKWLGAPATRVDGAGGAVTYRYPRLPAGTVKIGSHDASADIAAEVSVAGASGSAPYVRQARFVSTRGFRMMLVASVSSMTVTQHYARTTDGQVVPTDLASTITGSMMGKSGELKTAVTFADWQKVR